MLPVGLNGQECIFLQRRDISPSIPLFFLQPYQEEAEKYLSALDHELMESRDSFPSLCGDGNLGDEGNPLG